MEERTINELCEQVIKQMSLQNYSANIVTKHIKIYGRLLDYAVRHDITEYSEEVGKSFLRNEFSVQTEKDRANLRPMEACAPSAINKMNDWYYHGCFYRKPHSRENIPDWALDDFDIIEGYRLSIRMTDMSDTTKRDLLRHIQTFYKYLNSIEQTTVQSVTADILSRYVLSMQGDSSVYIQCKLQSLRRYFRYLHTHGILLNDWSEAVPRVTVIKNVKVPKIWSKAEIKTLLESIDRANPTGKRNYAMILLAVELGLRAVDIKELRLSNLDFSKKEIAVTQHKTGSLNVCPMSPDLGWALIDYIQHGRLKSDLPFVFLTSNAPYRQIGAPAITTVLKRQMRSIGMSVSSSNIATGIHSLRHSLAHRLLDENTSMELISNIMGHADIISSSTYLKGDISGLRDCALSLGGFL